MNKPGRKEQGAQTESSPPREVFDEKTTPNEDPAQTETWRSAKRRGVPDDLPQIPDYDTLGFIARGGMGFVVKARHRVLDRLVAIKFPLPSELTDEPAQERFLREARAAAKLRHPRICPIHEVGRAADQPYIVMGYIDGETLNAWSSRQRPTARQAAEMVAALARAVAYAHQHDVLHRDIKPGNVMVERDSGLPVLMDFGLAKEISQTESNLTQTGQLMGTPAYMAPEQAAGDTHNIGPRSDVYALGAVLYYLLCNRPPFDGTVGIILHKVQADQPPAPRKLAPRTHRDLETICLKAMAKTPEQRYVSADALASDLECFCAGEAILARREPMPAKVARAVRRRPLTTLAVASMLLLSIILGRYLVRANQISNLEHRIQSSLDIAQWTPQKLTDVETLIGRLERISPRSGALNRRRLHQQFAGSIQNTLKRPELDAATLASLESDIQLLANRDADLAEAQRAAFQKRRQSWHPLFDLKPPFDRLNRVFDDIALGEIRASGDALLLPDRSVVTRQASRGNVRLDVRLDAGWNDTRDIEFRIGTSINSEGSANQDRGFIFRVSTGERGENPAASAPTTPNRKPRVTAYLEILRNETLLRRQRSTIKTGPLSLTVTRQANRVELQVNDQPPVVFLATLPLTHEESGRFGVKCPPPARILALRASRQSLATDASPLQRGDDLFARGNLNEALSEYEKLAIAESDTTFEQQARLKQSLCLIELGRTEDAIPRLERLAGETSGRWPLVALAQLWRIRLQQKQFDEAYAIFESLAARSTGEQLAPLIPVSTRTAIVEAYHGNARSFRQFLPNPVMREQLKRAAEVEDFFEISGPQRDLTRVLLCRAHYMVGDHQQALNTARQLLREHPAWRQDNAVWWLRICEEYYWLLRLGGRADDAIVDLDRRLLDAKGNYRSDHLPLLVERARIHAALSAWEAAEQDLEYFFRLQPVDIVDYRYHAAACLLAGFLRERHGDHDAAVEAWRRGLPKNHPNYHWLKQHNYHSFALALMLASLSDEFSEDDVQWIMNRSIPSLKRANNPLINTGLRGFLPELTPQIIASVIRATWQSERGRLIARQMAFRELPPTELIRQSAITGGVEAVRQIVFDGQMTPEQESVVVQGAEEAYVAAFSGRFSIAQGIQLAFTWKGVTNFVGWAGIAPSLPASLRGPAAYIFGQRFLGLKQRDSARQFFRQAMNDSGENETLKQLAEEELHKLGTPAPDQGQQ